MVELRDQLQATLGAAYTVERELRGGGMSRTFVAEERDLGRRVVVKVLPLDLAATVSVERFRREVQLAARLQHPHIVPLLSAGAQGELLYYTMPFIAGESLHALLVRQGELPVEQVVRFARDVVDALVYAHANGVIHRDIKPHNVLISGNHAVVIDFGVSKAVSSATEAGTLTSAGIALGTPAYMSPEQATGDAEVDHRADLYAVGAMVYELLTGRPPFVGTTAQQVLAAHITRAPEPVRRLRESVPEAVEHVVMRCLEKQPADRWQSAAELLAALESASTGARAVRLPRATRRTKRSVLIIAGLATVLSAGVAAYYLGARHREVGHRIAVIPLIAVASDTARDLWPEFITQELRSAISERIAPFPGVTQINSVSADHFRGSTLDLDAVRTKLDADRVVQLGFNRAGADVSVLVELVNTADKTARSWRYRHDAGDAETRVFAARIAKDVIEQGLNLTTVEPGAVRHQATRAALDAYTRGTAIANQITTKAKLERAIAYFEAAIRADSAFAQPLARVALAYQTSAGLDGVPPSFAYLASERAAQRAVDLDHMNAEAHATLGWAIAVRSWSWADARQELRIAIDLDRSSAVAHSNLGWLLATQGDLRGALREAQEAIRLDPFQLINHLQVLIWNLALGRPDSAIAASRRKDAYFPGVEITPDLASSADAFREAGNIDRALSLDSAMAKGLERPTAALVISLERKGLHAQAVEAYDSLVAASKRQFIAAEFLARAANAIGDRKATLAWLRQAKEMHSDMILFCRWLPDMQPLLQDPEYRKLLNEMRLPAEPAQK